MDCISKYLLLLCFISLVSADTYNVNIGTESYVNLVDSRFMSFTIDPKYLFSSSEQYKSKECICMASSLSPSYIRIAGPSTAHMVFRNSTISITEDQSETEGSKRSISQLLDNEENQDAPKRKLLKLLEKEEDPKSPKRITKREGIEPKTLSVSHHDWNKFLQWANTTGFDLVFSLNNAEKMDSGMWDPNTALNVLTVAEKAHVGEIFWQLGYECTNQSIEEYLNDLETLRLMTETFPGGRAGRWRVVGGDVTGCLHRDSKSDFKDYVTLSNDMLDAVLLDGNSSGHELDRMSAPERLKLLKLLSISETPLWLTETPRGRDGLERAVDWLTGLGHAARNGFSVHYRELKEEELYEPTLSFYMALLFKNLVGERVLHIDMKPKQAIVFAHCTSLRHKAVPGAVTLFGANMDDEPARLSLKLTKREEGGDIMQFVLGQDSNGNIIVNGRTMYHEGDIKPVVKRVRPYKKLLINLPPNSFGFWVLANTNVQACQDEQPDAEFIEAVTVDDEKDNIVRKKRSIDTDDDAEDAIDLTDVANLVSDTNLLNNKNTYAINVRIVELNKNLNKIHQLLGNEKFSRFKRQTSSSEANLFRQLKDRIFKQRSSNSNSESKPKDLLGNLFPLTRKNFNLSKQNGNERKLFRNKFSKRKLRVGDSFLKNKKTLTEIENKVTRNRRSAKEDEQVSVENEVDISGKDNTKLWKLLKRIHKQLKDLSIERNIDDEDRDDDTETGVLFKLNDSSKEIDQDTGLIKSAVGNLLSVLGDLNDNLNRFWNALSMLD